MDGDVAFLPDVVTPSPGQGINALAPPRLTARGFDMIDDIVKRLLGGKRSQWRLPREDSSRRRQFVPTDRRVADGFEGLSHSAGAAQFECDWGLAEEEL